jgi:hypothetical protein
MDMVKFEMADGGMMAMGGEIELTNKDIFEKGKIKFYEFNGKVYANDRYKVIPHIKCKFLVEYKGKMYEVDGGVYEDGDIKISTSYQPIALSKSAFESKFEDSFEGGWQTISKYKPYKSKNDLIKSLKNDSLAFEGKMADGGMMANGDISDIQTPFYFKSKIGIVGMDKNATFQIQDIPNYGNIKVYYYDGILPRFFWIYKDELKKRIGEGDFIKSNKSKFQPKYASGGKMAMGGKIKQDDYFVYPNGRGIKRFRIKNIKGDKVTTEYSTTKSIVQDIESKEDLLELLELGYIKKVTEKEYWDKKYDNKMAMGGKTFEGKVKSVKKSLLERKKVSPKVQKDYGKTYSPKEAEESAKRIVGAMTAKERLMAKRKKSKK